jgi:hypothetical protein
MNVNGNRLNVLVLNVKIYDNFHPIDVIIQTALLVNRK